MIEFKVGDEVECIDALDVNKIEKGGRYTIRNITDSFLHLEEVPEPSNYQRRRFKLVTPKYRHGDVYSHGSGNGVFVIGGDGGSQSCQKNERNWIAKFAKRECSSFGKDHYDSYKSPKFLYNVFDKESADSDCDTPVYIGVDLATGNDSTVIYDSRCMDVKNKILNQEAIMPLTITKTTTTELPSGTPEDEYIVNDTMFDDISDSDAVELIRKTNAEIKAMRVDAKDSGSKRIAKDATELSAVRKVLVGLLDAREES